MGIYIKIHKLSEDNHIGYYEVLTDHFGGSHFFIGINRDDRSIKCYTTKDFSMPFKTIRFDSNDDEAIGSLPGVDANILGRVAIKALRVFAMDNFPEYLDYAS